jgi:hypothetical protein
MVPTNLHALRPWFIVWPMILPTSTAQLEQEAASSLG